MFIILDNDTAWIDENNSQLLPIEVEAEAIVSIIPTTGAKQNDDYVSSTLDKDPTQIFNDNEVFMTRSMARGLIDEHGFKPNSFGYRRNRAVAITFYSKQKGGRKTKQESVGYLREMHQDQVRVWYPDLHQSEWLPVGSRRLRVMTEEEEEAVLFNSSIDFNVQEVPPTVKQSKGKEKEIITATLSPATNAAPTKPTCSTEPSPKKLTTSDIVQKAKKKVVKVRQKKIADTQDSQVNMTGETTTQAICESTTVDNETKKAVTPMLVETLKETPQIDNVKTSDDFLTTGAFATRGAMRQLKDKNGFTPNPYGYTNGLAVEILNTRSGKTKFWECGRLVAMRPGQVRVHYEGWADVYDEWIMVGSRRIRVSNDTETPKDNQASTPIIGKAFRSNDLLIAESNPELTEEAKRNRKHQLVGPQDYQNLGMLVNLEELAVKEAQKKERRGKKKVQDELSNSVATIYEADANVVLSEDEEAEYLPDGHTTSKSKIIKKNKKPPSTKKKNQQAVNKCAMSCLDYPAHTDDEEIPAYDKQIISLRLAQAEASKSYKFIANVYGYDYMQHVTVLHLDKKLYEGRLVSMHKNKVKIHYCGWLDAFDEYITLGSRRLQAIENDHEVQCIEPNYRERYEQMLIDKAAVTLEDADTGLENVIITSSQPLINRFSRKRLTLDDIDSEEEPNENNIEYHKDPTGENIEEGISYIT